MLGIEKIEYKNKAELEGLVKYNDMENYRGKNEKITGSGMDGYNLVSDKKDKLFIIIKITGEDNGKNIMNYYFDKCRRWLGKILKPKNMVVTYIYNNDMPFMYAVYMREDGENIVGSYLKKMFEKKISGIFENLKEGKSIRSVYYG